MPSYIELDKQASFPASSDVGKLIFGVNTSNQAALTDVSGNTTIIGSGGCVATPCVTDFTTLTSYGTWFLGVGEFSIIQSQNFLTDFVTLELVAAQINGCNISTCSLSSITVNYINLTYRDDGYGLYPSNYVDFLNQILNDNGLYTTFSGASGNMVSNFCRLDNFLIIFKQTGVINDAPLTDIYYALKSDYGIILNDTYNVNILPIVNGFAGGYPWS
jgi:hypothetical protein